MAEKDRIICEGENLQSNQPREEQNVMNTASQTTSTHCEEALKDQPATKRDTAERFAGRPRSRSQDSGLLLLWFVSLVGRGEVAVELQNFD